MNFANIKRAICGDAQTCCESHGISDCNQGRKCPSRGAEYSVRVVNPGVAPLHYTIRAANSAEASQHGMERGGIGSFVSVKRVA